MKQMALTQFPWPELTLVPLILFFVFFVAVVIWVNLRANKSRFAHMSQLPLEGEEHE